jgi:hypothetical protein
MVYGWLRALFKCAPGRIWHDRLEESHLSHLATLTVAEGDAKSKRKVMYNSQIRLDFSHFLQFGASFGDG